MESQLKAAKEKKRIEDRNKFWLKADNYFRDSDWDKALRYYRKALRKNPLNPQLKENIRYTRAYKAHDKGRRYFERGDWDKAIDNYEQAYALIPNDQDILESLALARAYKSHEVGKEYYAREDWDNAIKHLKRAREYHNDFFFSHEVRDAEARKLNVIGHGYFKAEDWEAAIRHFRKAYYEYPFAFYFQKNLEAALGNHYYEIGGYLLHDEDWLQAVMYFERSLEYWPNDAEILRDLKKAKLGFDRQALRDRARQDFLVGERYLYRGNWDAAIRYFKTAEKNDPKNKTIKEKLKLAQKKKAEQEDLWRRTVGQPPMPPIKDLKGNPIITSILPYSELVTRLTGNLVGFRPALTRREELVWIHKAGPWLEAASAPFPYVDEELIAGWILFDWATDPVSFKSDLAERWFGTHSAPLIKSGLGLEDRALGLGLTNLRAADLLKKTKAAERLVSSQVPKDIKKLALEAASSEERYRELLYNDGRFSLYILGSVMQELHERVRKVEVDMRRDGKLEGWHEFTKKDYELIVHYAIERNYGKMNEVETAISDMTSDVEETFEKAEAGEIVIPWPWLFEPGETPGGAPQP